MLFKNVLASLMAQGNVTNYRLAKAIGCSQSTPANWLRGTIPDTDKLQKIADFFNVPIEYLLTGGEKEEPSVQTEPDITFDDFTYAMNNASGKLSQEEKDVLLGMAKQFEAARKLREKHEDSK